MSDFDGIRKLVLEAEAEVQAAFSAVGATAYTNQIKVLEAFREEGIAQRHFSPTTGYGYDDIGRDTLERLFARVFRCEDALVRPQFASGTHAIATAFFGLLAPGEHMLSITGSPYDTLRDAIDGEEFGSLTSLGIEYSQVGLGEDGGIDLAEVERCLRPNTRVVFMQRSRGYHWRNALSLAQMEEAVKRVKARDANITVLVDNCYGEFVEAREPSEVGADVLAGSLIKNPGGGLAPTGGYIAGNAAAVERIANRLTSPGIGREVGSYAASYAPFYQGLFMAPHVVGEAMKGRILAARLFEKLGYETLPGSGVTGGDIIQAVKFGKEEALIAFCQTVQKYSPVDSGALPMPWDMPGYADQVIMAAGAFVQGASIELSADAPIKAPYIAYFQGGLTYEHVKYALEMTLRTMAAQGIIAL